MGTAERRFDETLTPRSISRQAGQPQKKRHPPPISAIDIEGLNLVLLRTRDGSIAEGFMKESRVVAISLAGVFALSASMLAVAQNAAPEAAPPAPARPGLVILDFKPAMDDLMTMLVQPRHVKLYYAGQAKNWQLAGFEVNELRGALARIGRTIPNYRNINVDTAVAAIFADKLKAVDAAVKAGDLVQFNTAYGR
jgi:hypothetical protein